MDARSFGKQFEAAIYAAIFVALIGGIAIGACGTCAAKKFSEYKVSIDKIEKK